MTGIVDRRTTLPWVLLWAMLGIAHGHSRLSRHLITDDLSTVILVAEAQATAGPFYGDFDDYITSSDMLAAGRAGSPNVPEDRESVLTGGVPHQLTIQVYAIDADDGQIGYEYEGVEVYLWHTDALGVYSAVSGAGTEGQKWLRGLQVTDKDGIVTFDTILPGPYQGRALHYHLRLRLPGANTFVATTQLFFSDADWEEYGNVKDYPTVSSNFLPLSSDNIYRNLGGPLQEVLTLDLAGSFETSVTSKLNLGLQTTDPSLLGGEETTEGETDSTPDPEPTPTESTPDPEDETDDSSTTTNGATMAWIGSLLVLLAAMRQFL